MPIILRQPLLRRDPRILVTLHGRILRLPPREGNHRIQVCTFPAAAMLVMSHPAVPIRPRQMIRHR